jgi:Tol biopolymer transport system component/DNA-binding winged helix-turn-helix (wHTH) protein
MGTPVRSSPSLCFGAFVLDVTKGELRKGDTPLKLHPQPFGVLVLLAERAGGIVTREEIRSFLWGNHTSVDFDGGINFCIRQIRAVLGDNAESPRYVETIPKRGYRFLIEVSLITDEIKEPTSVESTLPTSGETSDLLRSPMDLGWENNGHTETARAALDISPSVPADVPAVAVPSKATKLPPLVFLTALVLCVAIALFAYPRRPFAALPHVVHIRQVTDSGRVIPNQHLVLSGSRIYFAARGGSGFQIRFFALDHGGESAIPGLSPQTELCDVSPSGTELLINKIEAGFPPMYWRRSLWRMPLSGGKPEAMGGIFADDSAWSPDGRTIVFTVEGERSVYLVGADGANARKLVSLPGTPFKPRWSPDGKRLRMSIDDPKENRTSLWEFDLTKNQLTPLLPGWNEANRLVAGNWTADGRYFLFVASRGGPRNLWVLQDKTDVLHKRTERPVQLTDGPVSFSLPTPSLDGKTIYAVGIQTRGQVMRYDSKFKKFEPYFQGVSADQFSFSKDGKSMAYVSYPEGTLVTSRLDGSQRLQLTFAPMRVRTPQWSPDGSEIVFVASSMSTESFKVYVVPSRGGTPRLLGPQTGREQRAPYWMPSGESIVFTDYDESDGSCVMHEWELSTGKDRVLSGTVGLTAGPLSPDGRTMAAITCPAEELVLYDLTSHSKRLVAQAAVFQNWSADGKYVSYSTLMKGPILGASGAGVYRVRVSDGRIERLAPLPSFGLAGNWGYWSGPAPDGSPLVLRELGTSDIYALELETR